MNASITDLRSQIDSLADFSKALEAAIELVKSLLSCPTCGTIADTRRDFTGGRGHRFSCVCPDCSTKWGTEACPSCKAWIPTLMPAVSSWAARDSTVGWLDRFLGADVLAVPYKTEDGAVGFVCPSCGNGCEAYMASMEREPPAFVETGWCKSGRHGLTHVSILGSAHWARRTVWPHLDDQPVHELVATRFGGMNAGDPSP